MTKTCYLHIGMGRCGSSAIQHFAAANRDALRAKGIFYPTSAELGFPEQRGGNAQQIADDARAAMRGAAEFIAQSRESRFLLSSEFLYGMALRDYAHLKDMFDKAGVRLLIISYVREQREWLLSRYAQAVKSRRWTMSLEEYLRARFNSPNLNYLEKFQGLKKLFGADDVAVRVFQRNRLTGGDARTDLFAFLGIDVSMLADTEATTNASASVLELEVMRAVNLYLPAGGFDHRKFLERSQHLSRSMGWTLSRELHRLVEPALMRQIGDFYRDSNSAFRQEFFPQIEDALFQTKIPDEYAAFGPQDRLNAQSIGLLMNYFHDLQERRAQAEQRLAAKEGAAPAKQVAGGSKGQSNLMFDGI